PVPANDRFGLAPFFRIEPLGLEYIAAALEAEGHEATIVDLRFGRSLERWLQRVKPRVVGIACMHALATDEALDDADRVRRLQPECFILIGGHSAAAYPLPFQSPAVDATAVTDGELVVPRLVEALEKGRPVGEVPGLLLRHRDGQFRPTPSPEETFALDSV